MTLNSGPLHTTAYQQELGMSSQEDLKYLITGTVSSMTPSEISCKVSSAYYDIFENILKIRYTFTKYLRTSC